MEYCVRRIVIYCLRQLRPLNTTFCYIALFRNYIFCKYIVLHCSALHSTGQFHSALHHTALQCNAINCKAVQYNSILHYNRALCKPTQCSTFCFLLLQTAIYMKYMKIHERCLLSGSNYKAHLMTLELFRWKFYLNVRQSCLIKTLQKLYSVNCNVDIGRNFFQQIYTT